MTAIIDFCMAVILMMIAVSGRSVLAFVFAVIFVGMGVYFLRYFERQRRLDNMTEEERAQFFANGGAILMPHEVERLNREKEEKEGFVKNRSIDWRRRSAGTASLFVWTIGEKIWQIAVEYLQPICHLWYNGKEPKGGRSRWSIIYY